jgi:hypothetical protein
MVKLLLVHGANVNVQLPKPKFLNMLGGTGTAQTGMTPLAFAATGGHKAVTVALLLGGADETIPVFSGYACGVSGRSRRSADLVVRQGNSKAIGTQKSSQRSKVRRGRCPGVAAPQRACAPGCAVTCNTPPPLDRMDCGRPRI